MKNLVQCVNTVSRLLGQTHSKICVNENNEKNRMNDVHAMNILLISVHLHI